MQEQKYNDLIKRTIGERLIIAKSLIDGIIDELPSTRPEHSADIGKMVADTISRQAAIDAVKGRFSMPVDNLIVEVISALPSAQPEPKKGKWIFHETMNDRYDDMSCPFCKKSYTVDAYRIDDIGFTAEDFNFCPNCGSDNRGEQE